MDPFAHHAAWTLLGAFVMSCAYEVYRATARAGVSKHDSVPAFVRESLPVYVLAAIVIGLLFAGWPSARWLGLGFAVAGIVASVFYYNPTIMPARKPTLIDWVEDLAFTGLLFVAATQLAYSIWL